MHRFFQASRVYQRAVVVVTAILILSIPFIVYSLSSIRETKPRAATFTLAKNPSTVQATTNAGGCSHTNVSTWSGVSNAKLNDDVRAQSTGTNACTQGLQASGFGFNIPSGSYIRGIMVQVERSSQTQGSVDDWGVRVVKNGTISNVIMQSGGDPPTSDSPYNFGSSTQLWGFNWTPADINSSSFGAVYWAEIFANSNTSVYVDSFEITVYYSDTPPDFTPPTVSITSPTNGTVVAGAVTITASASDNVGISRVDFYIDGVYRGQDTNGSPWQYSWNTTTYSEGSHSLYVKAYDFDVNPGTSSTITVTVDNVPDADTTNPSVSISSPSNGSTVSGTQSFGAMATDNVGVTSLVLKIDGSTKKTCSSGACSYSWDTTTYSNGSHTLQAVASDAAGNSASDTHTVTVGNNTGGPPPPPPPPPVKPTVNLTANPSSITSGAFSTLSWSSTDATSVTISPGVGTFGSSGSTNVSPSASITYQAVASGAGGNSDPDFASVTVNSQPPPPPPPKPTLSFSANPTSIKKGESSTLSWSSSNATSVTITPDIGTVGANGSTKITPSTSISYTAVASGAGGNSNPKSVSISVNGIPAPPPPPPPSTPIDSGVPNLPSGSLIPGGGVDPNVLKELRLDIKVPFLLGELIIPTVIGGFAQDVKLSPSESEYKVSVVGAKFKLGNNLSLLVGGNKTLSKKLNVKTKAQSQPVKVGSLYLGDITGDNVINGDDTSAFLSALTNQAPLADVNLDGVGNSLDWAVIRANFGKKGEK